MTAQKQERLLSETESWPECRDFYELMQRYRHTPITDQKVTIEAYEEIKAWLRSESKSQYAQAQDCAQTMWRDSNYKLQQQLSASRDEAKQLQTAIDLQKATIAKLEK